MWEKWVTSDRSQEHTRSSAVSLKKLEEKYVPISLLCLMLESEPPVGLFENNCPQRGFCRGCSSINTQLVSSGLGCVRLGLHGGGVGMGLCKSLFCWRRRNLRRGLWLANWSLLDWKTYTFLPLTSDSFFFPSWSPYPHHSSLFLSSVHLFFCLLVLIHLIFSFHLSLSFAACCFLSFTFIDLQDFWTAVSSFHFSISVFSHSSVSSGVSSSPSVCCFLTPTLSPPLSAKISSHHSSLTAFLLDSSAEITRLKRFM